MKRERFKMSTPFGKRRGWELQRLVVSRRVFWRLTEADGGCCPASAVEVILWQECARIDCDYRPKEKP